VETSTPDAAPASPDEARTLILAQHETIRSLLRAAGAVADLAAGGNHRVADLLPHHLDNVCRALESHLDFEERLLTPILMADLPLGPQRARALHEEHQRQRAELATLARGAADAPDVSGLAARLRTLITDFLTDMHHEEQFLLTCDVLRSDLVSVDQDCG
jgi:hypothetical protein